MVFTASADKTRWEGLLICTWILVADALLFLWALRRPIDWIKFSFIFIAALSIPLLLYWAYRTWMAFTVEYWVERNMVTVRWANERRMIPMAAIQQIIQGGVADLSGGSRLDWPAPFVRPGRGLGLINLTMVATRPLTECLVLEADGSAYALSPADGREFVAALQRRAAMGSLGDVEPTPAKSTFMEQAFGARQAGYYLIGAGLIGVLVLVGVLMVNFPSLPDALTLQYNPDGIPIVVRSKSALFVLPIVGFVAWFVNGIGGLFMAGREQVTGAYMLWGGAIVVQICSLLALLSVIP